MTIPLDEGEALEHAAKPASPANSGGVPSLEADDYLDETAEG
jgi:hypothetical protein